MRVCLVWCVYHGALHVSWCYVLVIRRMSRKSFGSSTNYFKGSGVMLLQKTFRLKVPKPLNFQFSGAYTSHDRWSISLILLTSIPRFIWLELGVAHVLLSLAGELDDCDTGNWALLKLFLSKLRALLLSWVFARFCSVAHGLKSVFCHLNFISELKKESQVNCQRRIECLLCRPDILSLISGPQARGVVIIFGRIVVTPDCVVHFHLDEGLQSTSAI